jgi:hypothetical protein
MGTGHRSLTGDGPAPAGVYRCFSPTLDPCRYALPTRGPSQPKSWTSTRPNDDLSWRKSPSADTAATATPPATCLPTRNCRHAAMRLPYLGSDTDWDFALYQASYGMLPKRYKHLGTEMRHQVDPPSPAGPSWPH